MKHRNHFLGRAFAALVIPVWLLTGLSVYAQTSPDEESRAQPEEQRSEKQAQASANEQPQILTPADKQPKIEREEKPVTMDERTYKRLSVVHELMGNNKQGEAIEKLRALDNGSLDDYAQALVWQTFGFLHAQEEEYPKSIEYFEKALKSDALPNAAQTGTLFSLAGLYTTREDYQKSIDTLMRWWQLEKDPKSEPYILMASNYAELEKYREALPYVEAAIAKSDKPQESWYQLALAIHFETEQYRDAVELLRTMVARWPNKLTYWETLAGAYQELEEDKPALAAQMLAYDKDLIDDERKLLNIVRMNLFLELPYDAGKMLAKEMEAGNVAENQKNLELLLSAWTGAREFDKAIAVIDKLAPMSETGDYYLQKAQLFAEKTEWDEAAKAARQAVDKGGMKEKQTGGAYLLLGIGLAELERYDDALAALDEAKNYDDSSRDQANGWIAYVRDRQQVTVAST
ncbi:MAG: tetratricopeptide repeat protein [Gammaproteobacteria bacterium]|nr:tetratricopeptide repeat protein [Gammaproteobacteria bacterium]